MSDPRITNETVRIALDAYQRAYPGGVVGARLVQMRAALEVVTPEPRPVIDQEAATKAAVDAILYNLPLDGFGQERRLTDYASIWGNAAAKAVLALLPKTDDGAVSPPADPGAANTPAAESAKAVPAAGRAPSSPIPQVEEGGEGDARVGLADQAVTEDGQQGLGPARPALSDSPNGSAS